MSSEIESLRLYYTSLLKEQRRNLLDYLFILEKQQVSITKENTDIFYNQTMIAEQKLLCINNLNKVIAPVKENLNHFEIENSDILLLEADVQNFVDSILNQNKKNRLLLNAKMQQIQAELKTTKKVQFPVSQNFASIIDIHA
ncbi:MAG: hypothetical protein ACRC4W_08535 [Treponemataceae bacterium]